MDELSVIATYFRPLSKKFSGSLALFDDAAIIPPPPKNHDYVITNDMIVQNCHFFGHEKAEEIAWKLFAVNISDLAAKGATPAYYLLAMKIPHSTSELWLKDFSKAIAKITKKYGGTLIGGDTVTYGKDMIFSVTAIGSITKNKTIKRNGAKISDDVYVTGTIGDAALALKSILKNNNDYAKTKYYKPLPRLDIGKSLVDIANSATDVSDGLILDCNNICVAAKRGMTIYADKIPFSLATKKALKDNFITYKELVTGGDDYELIFTASPIMERKIAKIAKKTKTKITIIGKIEKGSKVKLLTKNGKEIILAKQGYLSEITP